MHGLGQAASSSGLAMRLGLFKKPEQQQPALYIRGHQEIFFDVLPPIHSDGAGELRMREQVTDLKPAAFDRMHQNSR